MLGSQGGGPVQEVLAAQAAGQVAGLGDGYGGGLGDGCGGGLGDGCGGGLGVTGDQEVLGVVEEATGYG
jgi:hypothetical protein